MADKQTPIDNMHDELNLLTLTQRRDLHCLIDCHKHVNIPDSSLSHMFKPERNRTTRSGPKIVEVPQWHMATSRKAYSFMVPNHWHSIDPIHREIENQDTFKRTLPKEMLRDVDHPT